MQCQYQSSKINLYYYFMKLIHLLNLLGQVDFVFPPIKIPVHGINHYLENFFSYK